jgi:hypothetical protein
MNNKYISFITSFVSLSVIGGIFSYRLINSFLAFVLFPCLNTLLPDDSFDRMNLNLNKNLINIKSSEKSGEKSKFPSISIGYFIKELIIWVTVMSILYTLSII